MTDDLTPELVCKLSTLDAIGAVEEAITYVRVALANSFDRPVLAAMQGESEGMLVQALAYLNDCHECLTASAEAES